MLLARFIVGQLGIPSDKAISVAPPSKCIEGIQFKALPMNENIIYLGDSDVTINNGFPLSPNDGIFIPILQADRIYAISVVNTDKLAWALL